jgi:hypothetical protein
MVESGTYWRQKKNKKKQQQQQKSNFLPRKDTSLLGIVY